MCTKRTEWFTSRSGETGQLRYLMARLWAMQCLELLWTAQIKAGSGLRARRFLRPNFELRTYISTTKMLLWQEQLFFLPRPVNILPSCFCTGPDPKGAGL